MSRDSRSIGCCGNQRRLDTRHNRGALRLIETFVGVDFDFNPSQPPESALYLRLAFLHVYLF